MAKDTKKIEIDVSADDNASAVLKSAEMAQRELGEAIAFTTKLYEQSITPRERVLQGQEKLNKAYQSGKVTLEQYGRAYTKLMAGMQTSFAAQMASGKGGLAAPFMMNMGALASAASPMATYNRSSMGMNMGALAYMPDGRWGAGLGAMAAQRAASASTAAAQRAYLAQVRYNSNAMEQERIASAGIFGIGSRVAGYARAAAIPAAAGLYFAKRGFDEYAADDLSDRRLSAVLAATGRTDITASGISGFANDRSRRTLFGSGDTVGASARIAGFQHIGAGTFERTMRAAQDLATVMDTDVASAAMRLGKAMEDPKEFLGGLAKAGILVEESTQKQIVALAESGRLTQAHTMILDELNKRIGDAAEVAGAGASGSMARLRDSISDLAKVAGEAASPIIDFLSAGLRGLANLAQTGSVRGAPAGTGDVLAGHYSRSARERNPLTSVLSGSHVGTGFISADRAAVTTDIESIKTEKMRLHRLMNAEGTSWGAKIEINKRMTALDNAENILLGEREKLAGMGGQRDEWADMGRRAVLGGIGRSLGSSRLSSAAGDGASMLGSAYQYASGFNAKGVLGGIRSHIRDTMEANEPLLRLLEQSQTPDDVRKAALAELDRFGDRLTPDQRAWRRKQIDDEYRRATEEKKTPRERRNDESLKAAESRFLTRGLGMTPELQEAKKAFHQRAQTNKLLTNIDKKLKARPKVIGKF